MPPVRQEVRAWHTRRGGPGFPGKKTESTESRLRRKLKAERAASLQLPEAGEVTGVPGVAAVGDGVLPIQSSLGGGGDVGVQLQSPGI